MGKNCYNLKIGGYKLIVFGAILSFLLLTFSCSSNTEPDIEAIVSNYYKTYGKRTDFKAFLDFYDEDMVLEDIIFGERVEGKEGFAEFLDWENPLFTKKDSVVLVVEQQVIQGYEVVTQGYFTPFRWGDISVGNMHFTTFLTFNKEGKIIRHVDWINYPNTLINYDKRKDSNTWITN